MRALSFLVLLLLLSPVASLAQTTDAAAAKKALKDSLTDGVSLPVVPHVDSSVNIEAVMLPEDVVKRVFGREVSHQYAVIEVNISNRSSDAGFVLQSLFIDYSNWALANPFGAGLSRIDKRHYQSRASTQEVSSVEYRIVRGEMLDTQPWTPRNAMFRSVKVLGSIGTAFAFPFSSAVIRGIGAWNGAVVPGYEQLFPDGMDAQINRVSDYGFRNNKIIPQQSADIVVAFFPIERFLSPSLKSAFLKNPAIFFNPFLLALDPKSRKDIAPILESAIGDKKAVRDAMNGLVKTVGTIDPAQLDELNEELSGTRDNLATAGRLRKTANARREAAKTEAELTAASKAWTDAEDGYTKALKANDAVVAKLMALFPSTDGVGTLYHILQQLSLVNVNIVVSGIMTVDETTVPASITDSCFNHPETSMVGVAGDKTCYLKGRFLLGGIPTITGAPDSAITDIVPVKETNTGDFLAFTYKLKAPLNSADLEITVAKPGKNGQSVDSMKYRVNTGLLGPPVISGITQANTGSDVVVTGSGFYATAATPVTVSLTPVSGSGSAGSIAIANAVITSSQITIPAASVTAATSGCYLVSVTTFVGKTDSTTPQVKVKGTASGAADPTCN